MDQTKIAAELANDVSSENAAVQPTASHGANEIRSLNDLELALAGGGDGIVYWG